MNPQHGFASESDYNTLGQMLRQSTPDGGETRFWYDKAGRIRFSQNSRQLSKDAFSYVRYDAQGRSIETGESYGASVGLDNNVDDPLFPSVGAFVTRTVYSAAYGGFSGTGPLSGGKWQQYLFNKVSYVEADQDGTAGSGDEVFTVYSYDGMGNLHLLYQWVPGMDDWRLIKYDYSSIDGLVDQLELLQPDGSANPREHYVQLMQYSGDSRLAATFLIHKDHAAYNWAWGNLTQSDQTSNYIYNRVDGSLRRRYYGSVFANDYTYTLQGWLKGINHSSKELADDPGKDGTGSTIQDVFGMVLNYYYNDFHRSYGGSVSPFNSNNSNDRYLKPEFSLYDGNIGSWQQRIRAGSGLIVDPIETGNRYAYDEVSRLRESLYSINLTGKWTYTGSYDEGFGYDRNGNLQYLVRHSDVGGYSQQIDNFEYSYLAGTNRLSEVKDNSANYNYEMGDAAFDYDPTGNVIKEASAHSPNHNLDAAWTPDNKLRQIYVNGKEENMLYDGSGNVVRRHTKDQTGDVYEFYIRDATGNVLAYYVKDAQPLRITERYVYSSDQLAVLRGENDVVSGTIKELPDVEYLFRDHLGNVRVVVGQKNSSQSSVDVKSFAHIYAFGARQPFRNFNISEMRFLFNGQEQRGEIKGKGLHYTAKFWEYDAVYGRRWNLDPVDQINISNYAAFGNNPIWYNDPLGNVAKGATKEFYAAKSKIDDKVARYDRKISNALEKGKDKRAERLKNEAVPWREMQSDFNSIIESPTEFYYTAMPNADKSRKSGGGTSYNFDKDRVDINFYEGNIHTVVHESTHGAGFLRREWTQYLDGNGEKQHMSYDYNDEFKAYNFERIFDPETFYKIHSGKSIDQIIYSNYKFESGYQKINIKVTAEDIERIRLSGYKVATPK